MKNQKFSLNQQKDFSNEENRKKIAKEIMNNLTLEKITEINYFYNYCDPEAKGFVYYNDVVKSIK